MTAFRITLVPVLGTPIETLAADGQHIADTLRAAVEFHVNGVRCIAHPGGKADELVRQFGLAQQRLSTAAVGDQVAMS